MVISVLHGIYLVASVLIQHEVLEQALLLFPWRVFSVHTFRYLHLPTSPCKTLRNQDTYRLIGREKFESRFYQFRKSKKGDKPFDSSIDGEYIRK
jgi:hypothetical protein